jgi:uncharacterized protein
LVEDQQAPLVQRAVPVPERADPVTAADRIDSLDVLRGVAVLGIFVMNIQTFAMYGHTYFNPAFHGMWDGAGYAIWYASHVLADQKFMTIFSLLFGAGIVLFTSRKERAGQSARKYHYRRMGWLIVFGLLHSYLLWEGDILFLYGVCGLWVYLFRKVRPTRLIIIGFLVLGVGSCLFLMSGLSAEYWSPEARESFLDQSWQPPPEVLEEVTATYGGSSYSRQFTHRVPVVIAWQTFVLLFWGIWRAGGLMLIGMALYKLGVFNAVRSRKFYAAMVFGVPLGIPVVIYGIQQRFAHDWDPFYSFFIGTQFNYWGSLLVSGGYIGIVMLACKTPAFRRLTRPIAAAGRMAFSNYIGQTVIAWYIFYGTGLGFYNEIGRSGQLLIVASVWVTQLIVSQIWLKYFRFGPLEWLWRSLTYGNRQPFRA